MIDLAAFDVMTFDCYGTLIDWESGIVSALQPVVAAHGVEVDDERLLTLYAEAEQAEESSPYRPYREVLARVMVRLGRALAFDPAPDERDALARSLPGWSPFADTVPALRALSNVCALGILSNVDRDLFAATAERLQVRFRHLVTAEDAHAYKPSAAVFALAERTLGVPRDRWIHVAQSRFHDIAPANALGISTVHVDRRHDRPGGGATPGSNATATHTVPDLATLVRLAGA